MNLAVDTAMDLETNTTKGYFRENSLLLQQGRVLNNAIVKIAQTLRTGTNDIDTLDFIHMYLNDENQRSRQIIKASISIQNEERKLPLQLFAENLP